MKLTVVETRLDVLHKVSEEVDIKEETSTWAIKTALLNTFNKLGGRVYGLAAVQCGLLLRAMLLNYTDSSKVIIAYNPKVLFKFGSIDSNEGCMSECNVRYIVKRPLLALVSYTNEECKKATKLLTYKRARIFLHEFDHLNGILLQDKGRST